MTYDWKKGFIRHKDLSGLRFDRWAVIRRWGRDKHSAALWLCRCDCGVTSSVPGHSLSSGSSRSCGCLRLEATTTHGLTGDLTFRSWTGIIKRCFDPKHGRFEDWGGRGITVCERWQSFENFLADMGPQPGGGYSIERNDNDGNYEPDNCRWLKKELQARNRRTTRWIEFNGERLSLAEHAERAGVNYKWAWEQIVKYHRSPEAVFT